MRSFFVVAPLVLCAAACSSKADSPSAAPDAGDLDTSSFLTPPRSCAFTCPATACAESTSPYACPALADWKQIPHEDACPAWDGTSSAAPSACSATAATGDALAYTGPDPRDAATTILPDGRRVRAAGSEWLFDEADLTAGMPQSVIAVPGTSLLIVVDVGDGPHSVRAVDANAIGSGSSPVRSYVKFDAPDTLNANAAFVAPDLVLVATDDGVVQALKLDTATGQLTRDDARSIKLPQSIDDTSSAGPYYVGGLAVSPDGARLVVSGVFDTRVLVYDVTHAGYGKALGSVDVGGSSSFAAAFDPHDAAGRFAYVTTASNRKVVEIDLGGAAPKVTHAYDTDKNPQAITFFDARWLAVANDFGDTITVVDRASGATTPLPVEDASKLHGPEPTSLAFDPSTHRLYATLAGMNAVEAWSVDTSATPPKIDPLGRIPTSWWPSAVTLLPGGGGIAISSMRGHSNGPQPHQNAVGDGDSMHGVRGGIQKVTALDPAEFTAYEAQVKANDDVAHLAGAPTVTCPNGENDFPLPPTNDQGPSKKIDHVFFVVRENKTFDALLGDMPGVEGSRALTMKSTSADMDRVWPNLRQLARTFAISDNYYTSAELSIQGHTWTVYGRTNDFTERTWMVTGYSRSAYRSLVQPQGVADIGSPEEGSVFDWLIANHVPVDALGEAEGMPKTKSPDHPTIDTRYPGGFIQSIGYPDVEKACYVAARARVTCNLGKLVYMTLPNDHTTGVSDTKPSPEVMVAVNDEATGMLVDAISHSPLWASSLIIVTEDDPSDGGDHVDHHRTPVLFASPWVKRGYVSKQHIDIASIHKIFAHVLGIPYPNAIVAGAALPLDLFTGTPNFEPFTHQARAWPLTCGQQPTLAEQSLSSTWDFDEGVDEQPGLDAQVRRWMRGEPLRELTPAMKEDLARRALRRRRGGDD